MPDFINLTEDATSLSVAEMREMENIIHQSFIETKRQQVLQNNQEHKSPDVEEKKESPGNSLDLLNTLNGE